MGGVNSKIPGRILCFSRTQNSSGNLKILPGIGTLGKFSGKDEAMKLKFQEFWDINFWEIVPKIQDNTPNFWEDFY